MRRSELRTGWERERNLIQQELGVRAKSHPAGGRGRSEILYRPKSRTGLYFRAELSFHCDGGLERKGLEAGTWKLGAGASSRHRSRLGFCRLGLGA